MTDDELRALLEKADALLGEYEEVAEKAVAEIARRKSLAVYGDETSYRGHLGCYEMGVETLCAHLVDARIKELYEDTRRLSSHESYEAEDELRKKFPTKHCWISGHH